MKMQLGTLQAAVACCLASQSLAKAVDTLYAVGS